MDIDKCYNIMCECLYFEFRHIVRTGALVSISSPRSSYPSAKKNQLINLPKLRLQGSGSFQNRGKVQYNC